MLHLLASLFFTLMFAATGVTVTTLLVARWPRIRTVLIDGAAAEGFGGNGQCELRRRRSPRAAA